MLYPIVCFNEQNQICGNTKKLKKNFIKMTQKQKYRGGKYNWVEEIRKTLLKRKAQTATKLKDYRKDVRGKVSCFFRKKIKIKLKLSSFLHLK